jgi:hypothetical protein
MLTRNVPRSPGSALANRGESRGTDGNGVTVELAFAGRNREPEAVLCQPSPRRDKRPPLTSSTGVGVFVG